MKRGLSRVLARAACLLSTAGVVGTFGRGVGSHAASRFQRRLGSDAPFIYSAAISKQRLGASLLRSAVKIACDMIGDTLLPIIRNECQTVGWKR